MAHFSRINNHGVVDQVICVSNDVVKENFPESEPIGQEFIKSLGIEGNWVQTSRNSNFRGAYGEPGSFYDKEKDIFIYESEIDPSIVEEVNNSKL